MFSMNNQFKRQKLGKILVVSYKLIRILKLNNVRLFVLLMRPNFALTQSQSGNLIINIVIYNNYKHKSKKKKKKK